MTATTWPSAKQAVGLAVEVNQGTAVTTLAASMPLGSFAPEDDFTWLDDEGMRGSMVSTYGAIQGVRKVNFTLAGAVFFDWFPYLLNNILGDKATSGAGPYTHAFSTLNSGTAQPGSLTFTDYQGLTATSQARTYSGCCLSELVIKGNPESSLLEFTAKGTGWTSAAYPTAPPAFSFSTETPYAAWRAAIGLGGPATGGTQNLTVGEWQVTITREVKPIYTSQNSQLPYIMQRGKVDVTGTYKYAAPSDETALNYLIDNTQPITQIVVDNQLATTLQRKLTIDCQVSTVRKNNITRDDEIAAYDNEWRAVANTTNAGGSGGYSPTKITIINNTVGSDY